MQSTILKFFGGGKFLLALATVVFVLAACKVEDAATATNYTITVEPRGGTGVDASYTVKDGETISIPDPKKDNNKFLGWCYTADGTTVDFVSGVTKLSENKTIYALWQQLTVKVTVNANTGKLGAFTEKTLSVGDLLAEQNPSDLPTKTDYEIAYWSKSPDTYSDLFEFGKTPVTTDITIYPHWRYTLAKVRSLLIGDWDISFNYKVFKIDATQGIECSVNEYSDATILVAMNSDPLFLTTLKNLTESDGLKVTSTILGKEYYVQCLPHANITLTKYLTANDDTIAASNFVYFRNTKSGNIILSSEDAYTNSIKITTDNEGTATGTRITYP